MSLPFTRKPCPMFSSRMTCPRSAAFQDLEVTQAQGHSRLRLHVLTRELCHLSLDRFRSRMLALLSATGRRRRLLVPRLLLSSKRRSYRPDGANTRDRNSSRPNGQSPYSLLLVHQ